MSDKSMTLSRRDVLLTALSAAAVAALPGIARAQAKDERSADAQFSTMLDDFSEEILRLSPTAATTLGLDSGARYTHSGGFNETSP